MDRQVRANTEERVVTILDVNLSQLYIMVRDDFGTQLRVSMQFHDPILVVPEVSERWTLERRGMEWFLNKKADDDLTISKITDLLPGDQRIESNGNLYINTKGIVRGGLKERLGTAAPTTGTWKVGDRVLNTTPAAAGYIGWVCVVAGTPGTWKGYGLIAS